MIGSDAQTGILLVGHGTRQPDGNRAFLDVCRAVALRAGNVAVEPSFLEIAEPAIGCGLARLARRGVSRVVVVPMQLTAGRHVRRDIPRQVHRALERLPRMSVAFADYLGTHSGLLDLAQDRLHEALEGRGQPSSSALLLVARGSRDALVRDEILRLARIRRELDGIGDVFPCFLGMSEPSFDEVLRHVAGAKPGRIVVQPHLLLPGRLTEKMDSAILDMSAACPQIEWVVVPALGPDARLASFAMDLASEGLRRLR